VVREGGLWVFKYGHQKVNVFHLNLLTDTKISVTKLI
jgi:hypothetical protein